MRRTSIIAKRGDPKAATIPDWSDRLCNTRGNIASAWPVLGWKSPYSVEAGAMGKPDNIIHGVKPDGTKLYAAIDPSARFVEGKVAELKLGASLSPFPALAEAEAALIQAGALLSREIQND